MYVSGLTTLCFKAQCRCNPKKVAITGSYKFFYHLLRSDDGESLVKTQATDRNELLLDFRSVTITGNQDEVK